MTTEHASEEQLQLYAIDGTLADEHIQHCAVCQVKAAAYRELIMAIEADPIPMPDFNVSELVLPRLERRSSNWKLYVLSALAMLPIAIGVYYFREQLFAGISIFLIALLAVSVLCIVIATIIDQVKTYQVKMNILASK